MACEKVIEKPGITMNPLLILGDSGCGKSHILSASVQAMIRRQDGMSTSFLPRQCEDGSLFQTDGRMRLHTLV